MDENTEPSTQPGIAELVRTQLQGVIDPELGASIVELGMVGDISVTNDGIATVTVALTTAACPLRGQIEEDVRRSAGSVDGVAGVEVVMGQLDPEAKAQLMDTARKIAQTAAPATSLPSSARVLGISSGKGGVGKSSVTANLAVALARQGQHVGILDADIWGFSIPRLLGLDGALEAKGGKIIPRRLEIEDGHLEVVSMGFLAEEDQAVMWRGLILSRAVQQFIEDVAWGELDVLLIDLPPGTGDVQMALARLLPRTELVLVTTPQLAVQKVAARAGDMGRRGNLRLAGVIENMSSFTCAHGETHALFGVGGGERLAESLGVELLGHIPIDASIAAGGDAGQPVALDDGSVAAAFAELARRLVAQQVPSSTMAGCSARMLELLDAAVEHAP